MPKRVEGQPHRREEAAAYTRQYRDKDREAYNNSSRAAHARRMKEDPEYAQMKRDSARWSRRKAKYGLTREKYEAMKTAQDGKCAVCGAQPDYDLRVDHDHKTGEVRALLCSNCNSAIGLLNEDMEVLQAAIRYLETHKK